MLRLFRVLFEDSVTACFVVGDDGVVAEANRSAHVLLGRAPDTLAGFTIGDAGLMLDQPGIPSVGDVTRVDFSHPDGRRLLLDCVARPLQAAGEWGIVWWVTDVTGLVNAEQALEEAEKRIRQGERLETLGTLAGGLAHDFNNLLAPIIGNVELALLEAPDESTIQKDLETAHSAALRAAELASQLLHLSRPERDSVEPVRVQDIMMEAVALLTAKPGESVEIVERIDEKCPPICGSRTQMHQVLFNLCKNAVQAMPGGGTLTVTVEFTGALATLKGRGVDAHGGGFVRVIISDTGMGMTPETLERLFDPFFTTKAEGSGSGLGLSMVKSIVSSYGGSIDVKSTPGKGSTFTLVFPELVDASSSERGAPA